MQAHAIALTHLLLSFDKTIRPVWQPQKNISLIAKNQAKGPATSGSGLMRYTPEHDTCYVDIAQVSMTSVKSSLLLQPPRSPSCKSSLNIMAQSRDDPGKFSVPFCNPLLHIVMNVVLA